MTNNSSLTHPGPWASQFGHSCDSPIHWDGIRQLGKGAVELLVASRWEPACTDAARLCIAAAWVAASSTQHPSLTTPACHPVPTASHVPASPTAPTMLQEAETQPWSLSLPIAVFETLAKEKYKAGIPDGKIE